MNPMQAYQLAKAKVPVPGFEEPKQEKPWTLKVKNDVSFGSQRDYYRNDGSIGLAGIDQD